MEFAVVPETLVEMDGRRLKVSSFSVSVAVEEKDQRILGRPPKMFIKGVTLATVSSERALVAHEANDGSVTFRMVLREK